MEGLSVSTGFGLGAGSLVALLSCGIHTILLGKFGSGKSSKGTNLVIDELRFGERPIVTTLALNVAELNEYMQRLCPTRDCRTLQRVFVLDKAQMKKFWRYRGVSSLGEYGSEPILFGACGDHAGTKDFPEAADPRWENVGGGVFYVIDEAPVAFHARRYAETGTECSDYITQHRKFGDEVWSLARSSELLDKQFRLTADRCAVADNWYQRTIGMFTAPKKLRIEFFENCPPGMTEAPYRTEDLKIDPEGYSRCFYTAKGVGVAGVGADIGKRAKGLPWWVMLVVVAVCGTAAWFGLHYTMRGLLHLAAARGSAAARAGAALMQPVGSVSKSNGVTVVQRDFAVQRQAMQDSRPRIKGFGQMQRKGVGGGHCAFVEYPDGRLEYGKSLSAHGFNIIMDGEAYVLLGPKNSGEGSTANNLSAERSK